MTSRALRARDAALTSFAASPLGAHSAPTGQGRFTKVLAGCPQATPATIHPEFGERRIGRGNNNMKMILKIFCACTAIVFISSGCSTCTSVESNPGTMIERSDPYMFWICSYFWEANDRWPTNTPELVNFLEKDYTNMIQEIEIYYKDAKYEVQPGGMLFLKSSGDSWSSTKRIRTNMLNSGNAEK